MECSLLGSIFYHKPTARSLRNDNTAAACAAKEPAWKRMLVGAGAGLEPHCQRPTTTSAHG